MTHAMTQLVLQLAVIVLTARTAGWLCKRYLKLPADLGEIAAGILIGPFALGGIRLPVLGAPLFPALPGAIPLSSELYGFAVLASIILLFTAGLETDLPLFLRFSGKAMLVGLGGAILSFALGAGTALLLPGVDALNHPAALFLGTLATATSVGITARMLSERRRLSSPEGVTVMAAAVLDDVIGIILLAVVAGLAVSSSAGEPANWGRVGAIAGKAVAFWLVTTTAGILVAPALCRRLKRIDSMPTVAALCFGLALFLAGLAELAGLAMIIGAYIAGLSLSQTDIAGEINERLHGLYEFMVPLFFAVMGMLVNLRAIPGVFGFGLIYVAATFVGKLLGCGLPALATGFNLRGALRIGTGMLPRGEVTLIIAGTGLATGAIGPELFGVAVMALLAAGFTAPPLLAATLRGGSGYRGDLDTAANTRTIELEFPSPRMAAFVAGTIRDIFRQAGFFICPVDRTRHLYSLRRERVHITLDQPDVRIRLSTDSENESMTRLLLLDALLDIKAFIESIETMRSPDMMGAELMRGLFATTEPPSAPDRMR